MTKITNILWETHSLFYSLCRCVSVDVPLPEGNRLVREHPDIEFSALYRDGRWINRFHFKNEEDAILFKLTWWRE